jgi:hypothetical protein
MPIVSFYASNTPQTSPAGEPVTFECGTMGFNPIISTTWDMGDGTVFTDNRTSFEYAYAVPGSYTINVQGEDDVGSTFSIDLYQEVTESLPPLILIASDQNTIFLPVELVPDEEYAAIRGRGITNALPQVCLDNGGYPNRNLFFWPIPSDSTKAIEVWLWEPLRVLDLDEQLNLPPGYERYLTYALALELCDEFGKQPTGEMIQSLAEAENNIKSLNQTVFQMEATQAGRELASGGDVYNIIDFYAGSWMLPRKAT